MAESIVVEKTKHDAVQTLRESRGEPIVKSKWKDIVQFLIQYNVMQFVVAFVIAGAAKDFMFELANVVLQKTVRKQYSKLWTTFITFLFMIVVMFLFIYYIFYPISTSKGIVEETELKAVVERAKKKELEKKADSVIRKAKIL